MATETVSREAPADPEALAQALRSAGEAGQPVRVLGGGTKLQWGVRGEGEPAIELSTERLDRVLEHNAGDMTAVVEAGIPFAGAQQTFAAEGQMLALDPPDLGGATLGGIVATADSGPLRARYGAARDLVLGVRVALSDGSLAQAGGKVIKNVAGYDLAKLYAGSFGTLGAIVSLSVRLHPLPPATITARGSSSDPAALAAAASALSHAPIEQHACDVRWRQGHGALLSRFAGAAPRPQAETAAALLREAGLEVELIEDDDALWEAQREGQRSDAGTVVRISARQTQLADVLRAAAHHDAALVGRAGLGLAWLRLESREPAHATAAVMQLRADLSPAPCVVLDAPTAVRAALDPWDGIDAGARALMRRIRERFDPTGVCAPGILG
jgi:glycolate oxidase FAD binding subunit